MEVLAPIIALYPASMTDTILEHAAKVLGMRERMSQKSEALSKLDIKTDNGESYIPGPLQIKKPIVAPAYVKDN